MTLTAHDISVSFGGHKILKQQDLTRSSPDSSQH